MHLEKSFMLLYDRDLFEHFYLWGNLLQVDIFFIFSFYFNRTYLRFDIRKRRHSRKGWHKIFISCCNYSSKDFKSFVTWHLCLFENNWKLKLVWKVNSSFYNDFISYMLKSHVLLFPIWRNCWFYRIYA